MAASLSVSQRGCEHYKRNCRILAPCCNNFYTCRLCHDENEDHVLDRHSIKTIVCNKCSYGQPAAKRCHSCHTILGSYYCDICKLFDNEDKEHFHCASCGICRVGGKNNFFHCKECGLCLSITLQDYHKCVKNVSRRPCPICNRDLHSSMGQLSVLICGHVLHKDCLSARNPIYPCPLC